MDEKPTCTCIRSRNPETNRSRIRVVDPFCHVPSHKITGSCAEPAPYPPKETKNP